MASGVAEGALLLLALLAANLPFLTERFCSLWLPRSGKTFFLRLLELLVLYLLVGVVGRALEAHAGQIAPQGWEFYAITGTLFLTFAFPGFVYRYLLRRSA